MMETVPSEGREKKSRLPRGPKPEWFFRDDAHEPNPGPKINRRENGPRIDGTIATATAKAKASMRSSGTPGSRGRLLSRPDPVAPVRQMLRESPPATGSAKEQAERDLIMDGPARGHWTMSQLLALPITQPISGGASISSSSPNAPHWSPQYPMWTCSEAGCSLLPLQPPTPAQRHTLWRLEHWVAADTVPRMRAALQTYRSWPGAGRRRVEGLPVMISRHFEAMQSAAPPLTTSTDNR